MLLAVDEMEKTSFFMLRIEGRIFWLSWFGNRGVGGVCEVGESKKGE